jgi:type I restriction enzyme M protein
VPEGIIFQSNKAYTALRKKLVEDGLFAVVSLPSGVFLPYSGVKTSILLFDKELAKRTKNILFVKIQHDGFDLGAQRREIDKNDLPLALQIIKKFKYTLSDTEFSEDEKQLAHVVTKEKIIESGDYNLSGERYKEVVHFVHQKWPMVELGEVLDLSGKDKVKDEDIPVMSITMYDGLIDQSDKFKKRIASKDISNYKKVYFNELVVGFPIDEGVLGFQTKYQVAAVSPAYDIWKLKNDNIISISYFEKILRSNQAREIYKSKMQGAVSRRRSIPKSDFVKIQIPLPPLEVQKEIVEQIEVKQKAIDHAKAVIESLERETIFWPSTKEVRRS